MVDDYKYKIDKYKIEYELHCPVCGNFTGDKVHRTEQYSQYIAYCKPCKCEFTVYYFKYVRKNEVKNG